MTGTLVRRLTGATSLGAFLFGFIACLFLAPIPIIAGPHFSSWAVGLIFGITLYGLAAPAVLLAMYGLAVLGGRPPTWALAAFAGSRRGHDPARPRRHRGARRHRSRQRLGGPHRPVAPGDPPLAR